MMKRPVYFLAILSILLFACNISTTGTPPATPAPVTPAPVATDTPNLPEPATATEPPEPPTATEPPAPQTNVTCNGLALFLDPALASGFTCTIVPEAGSQGVPGFEVNPKYTELSLTGYVLSDRFFTPKIYVYPVQRFTELLPDVIPERVAALQSLIGGAPSGEKGLPLLPIFNAGQEFFAQYTVISFGSGNGIRFLTQYSQYVDPINNHELFYTFQGLTGDGKYWVSAILPVSNPLLPADGNNPPNGQSQEDFSNNFTKYIAELTTQLNAQAPESFSPGLAMLDALVGSIQIQP
jgi:hypothetical protein